MMSSSALSFTLFAHGGGFGINTNLLETNLINLIIVIGVGSSVVLENEKIAAVMGLLGAALTALISMLNGIAGANTKQEKPEFEVMKQLIDKLDKLDRKEQPMKVTVEGEKVTVTKGDDQITTSKG
jgi:hypothetical protein